MTLREVFSKRRLLLYGLFQSIQKNVSIMNVWVLGCSVTLRCLTDWNLQFDLEHSQSSKLMVFVQKEPTEFSTMSDQTRLPAIYRTRQVHLPRSHFWSHKETQVASFPFKFPWSRNAQATLAGSVPDKCFLLWIQLLHLAFPLPIHFEDWVSLKYGSQHRTPQLSSPQSLVTKTWHQGFMSNRLKSL